MNLDKLIIDRNIKVKLINRLIWKLKGNIWKSLKRIRIINFRIKKKIKLILSKWKIIERICILNWR